MEPKKLSDHVPAGLETYFQRLEEREKNVETTIEKLERFVPRQQRKFLKGRDFRRRGGADQM